MHEILRVGSLPPDQNGMRMDQAPELFNLTAYSLLANVEHVPNKTALVFASEQGPVRYSYAQVAQQVSRFSHQLSRADSEKGDRILLRLPNAPAYAFAFLAAAGAGMVAVPISPQLSSEEVQFLLDDSGARWIWTTRELASKENLTGQAQVLFVEDALVTDGEEFDPSQLTFATTQANDPAYLVYTSGTTAHPKGVLHAHRSVWGRRPMRQGWTDFQPDDVVLHAGQLNWTYTMGVGILDVWAAGATSVLYDGPNDPTRWPSLIQEHKVTIFAAVPTVFRQILKYNPDPLHSLASLRHALTAGEALRPQLLKSWRERVGIELYEALGMSECSTYISSGPSTPIQPGSPGIAQAGRTVAILPRDGGESPLPAGEVGLLAIHRSDPGLMLGYWNRPTEEAEVYRGEWFAGGDLAAIDDNGYIWFQGRNNDLMNAMGFRVSPLEIERTLEKHPMIREAGVTELQVREDVSVICAWLTPENDQQLTAQELQSYCAEHLATYKCPREWRWVQALPRTRSGKLQRQNLHQFQPSSDGTWLPPEAAPSKSSPGNLKPHHHHGSQVSQRSRYDT